MTRVDFYVTPQVGDAARASVACRLAAKAFSLGRVVHINTASADAAANLDRQLWTFRDGAFVPHALAGDPLLNDPPGPRPVVLGHAVPPADDCDLLINLDNSVPEYFSRVERVAEIIDADPARREGGRERFRFYRDRGYEVDTHKL